MLLLCMVQSLPIHCALTLTALERNEVCLLGVKSMDACMRQLVLAPVLGPCAYRTGLLWGWGRGGRPYTVISFHSFLSNTEAFTICS